MLYVHICQFGYLVIWGLVLAGGVIFLRRGQTHAVPALFGAGVLLGMQVFYMLLMILTRTGAIESTAADTMYEVMWVPQLLGGFLFAFGFLRLARTARQEA